MTQANVVWKEICAELGGKVGSDVVDRWLAEARICAMKGDLVKLEFPTKLHVDWVDTYFRSDLVDTLGSFLGAKPEVVLVARPVGEGGNGSEAAESPAELIMEESFVKTRPEDVRDLGARIRAAGLNPSHSLENFVLGKCNELAHATAVSVIEKPGEHPVLFYGFTGVGKTHLMTALGLGLLGRHPRKRVLFVTAEQFTNEFIEAVQRNKLPQFRARYRKVDVLLIDDVQFLGGKEATQDEFFHTFNTLTNSHSQIVLTSERPPSEIPGLDKPLVSRFLGGFGVEIHPPGLETRIAILRQKAHEMELDLDSSLVEFLASRIRRDVRHLESALLRISLFTTLYRRRMAVSEVEDYLRDALASETREGMVTIAAIQQEVAEYYEVRPADLNGRSRSASIVQPRQIAMYLSRELTQSSLKEIGRAFGGRDHGTVIHAIKKVREEARSGGECSRVLEYFRGKISG